LATECRDFPRVKHGIKQFISLVSESIPDRIAENPYASIYVVQHTSNIQFPTKDKIYTWRNYALINCGGGMIHLY